MVSRIVFGKVLIFGLLCSLFSLPAQAKLAPPDDPGDPGDGGGYYPPPPQYPTVQIEPWFVTQVVPPTFSGINYLGVQYDPAGCTCPGGGIGCYDITFNICHGTYNPAGTPAVLNALRTAGVKTVRFPGGTHTDFYDYRCPFWDPGYQAGTLCPSTPQSTSWGVTDWHSAIDFAQSLGGGRMLFQTNVYEHPFGGVSNPTSGAGPSDPAVIGALAAQLTASGVSAVDFEIGNEPENPGISGADYGVYSQYTQKFIAQARAIHAANPQMRVFGPATNEADVLIKFLDQIVAAGAADQVDGVSIHVYPWTGDPQQLLSMPQWFSSPNAQTYIDFQGGSHLNAAAYRNLIGQHLGRYVPIYVSEWHITAATVGVVPECERYNNNTATAADIAQISVFAQQWLPPNFEMSGALMTADMLGAFAASGIAGEQFFAMHDAYWDPNDQNVAFNLCTHGHSLFGLFTGEGDFELYNVAKDQPVPAYYALELFGQLGGNIVAVNTPFDAAAGVSAYAATDSGGNTQLLLIEKAGAWHDFNVTGYSSATTSVAVSELLSGGSFTADYTQVNFAQYTDSVGGPQYWMNLQPYSIVVLNFQSQYVPPPPTQCLDCMGPPPCCGDYPPGTFQHNILIE